MGSNKSRTLIKLILRWKCKQQTGTKVQHLINISYLIFLSWLSVGVEFEMFALHHTSLFFSVCENGFNISRLSSLQLLVMCTLSFFSLISSYFSTLPKGKDYDVRKAVKKIDFSQLLDHFVQIQKTHASAGKNKTTHKTMIAKQLER